MWLRYFNPNDAEACEKNVFENMLLELLWLIYQDDDVLTKRKYNKQSLAILRVLRNSLKFNQVSNWMGVWELGC